MTSPEQPSLFEGPINERDVMWFAMIGQGYYLIEGKPFFLSIDGKSHVLNWWNDKRSRWMKAYAAIEVRPGEFSAYAVNIHPTEATRPFWQEMATKPTKFKVAYGRAEKRCGECGREVKHPRSQWYGIGPDCEETNYQYITEVDEANGGVPWEAMQ